MESRDPLREERERLAYQVVGRGRSIWSGSTMSARTSSCSGRSPSSPLLDRLASFSRLTALRGHGLRTGLLAGRLVCSPWRSAWRTFVRDGRRRVRAAHLRARRDGASLAAVSRHVPGANSRTDPVGRPPSWRRSDELPWEPSDDEMESTSARSDASRTCGPGRRVAPRARSIGGATTPDRIA